MFFPDKKILKEWGLQLSDVDDLGKYLPVITNIWAEKIENCIEVAKLHPDREDLHKIAARLFYKIIKNHVLVDGNKRSAVITVYLFYYMNGYRLTIQINQLYDLSRMVAATKTPHEDVIKILSQMFVQVGEQIK